jgi:uncharacterized protein YegL
MTGWSLTYYKRRFPVFFLLDASQEMQGAFEVAMRAGLDKFRDGLLNRQNAEYIDVTVISFGEKVTHTDYERMPLRKFVKPAWLSESTCNLQPAISCLADAFEFILDAASPGHPGDYAPLIFLIIGSHPLDPWQMAPGRLTSFTDNRRPMIITLLIRREAEKLGRELNMISHVVLTLQEARAEFLTRFFVWLPTTLITILESYIADYEDGKSTISFPALPPLPPGIAAVE